MFRTGPKPPCYALLALLLASGGCAGTKQRGPTVEDMFYDGEYAKVVQQQLARALYSTRDSALAYLSAASAQICLEEYDDASQSLQCAQDIMWSYSAIGEAEAIRGREEEKFFRGDPYEKAMAAFYLGMIDYMSGRLENALASFKTALVADGGTQEARDQSDFLPAVFMEGIAYRSLGEHDNAAACVASARVALVMRISGPTARSAVVEAARRLSGSLRSSRKDQVLMAAEVIFAELGRSEEQVVSPALMVRQAAQRALGRSAETRTSASGSGRELDWAAVKFCVERLREEAERVLAEQPESAHKERVGLACAQFEDVTSASNNLIVFADLGRGPFKIRAGGRNELARFTRGRYADRGISVRVSEREKRGFCLENIYFQASTRGGREFDLVLGEKAFYKDTMDAAGALAFAQASVYTLPVALLFWGIRDSIQSEADIRCWSCLPGEIHVAAFSVPPGEHEVVVKFLDLFGEAVQQCPAINKTIRVGDSSYPTVVYVRSHPCEIR